MTKRLALLALALVVLPLTVRAVPGPRQKQWKHVEEAVAKGLPRTAIERLEPIIAAALKDKAYPEAIKAIARKIALESNIEGNKPEEAIVRMQEAIARTPAECHPVMEAILANWYWHYFQQNNWRFLDRTRTAQAPGKDFTTWDLPQILAEIDRRFQKALANDRLLRSIPIAQYDDLLVKGNAPDRYRPTLYNFLAHNALAFYSAGEQAGAAAQDAFELTADSPALGPVEEFLAWKIVATDSSSHLVKALRLYQDLLRFHREDKEPTAFLDADLFRLQFSRSYAVGDEKDRRYKDALKHFVEKAGKHEIAARALYAWASALVQEGRQVEARKLARRGVKEWPDSIGGRLCHNLIQEIEAKSTAIETERVWNAPWPTIDVRYRNLTKVYFRAVPAKWQEAANRRWADTPMELPPIWDLDEEQSKTLLARKAVRVWSADLPATADYKERTEKVPVPQDLKPGFYFLLASHTRDFGNKDNQVTFTTFWVSNLALVPRLHWGKGALEGFVLNANSGAPIGGAAVELWARRGEKLVAGGTVKTNAEGLFRFEDMRSSSPIVVARHQGQEVASGDRLDVSVKPDAAQGTDQTVFFTDRALYRPGQTIHYRGICLQADPAKDHYRVLPAQALTVILKDVNNREVARREHRTNEYGSFSGSFTAPTGRLTGTMRLRVEDGPLGDTHFNVEEYKRPKFQVTLEAPKTAPRLNGPARLGGKAVAYTGAPVDGAKVRYRVVREVLYPPWLWWTQPPADQEIAHGATATTADGSFEVQFLARPDRSVTVTEGPMFRYSIVADVTDRTGETRSGVVVVNVGYTALQASLTADEWQTKDREVKLTVGSTTLDGEPQQAAGTVKVHRLRQPEKIQRRLLDRLWPGVWDDGVERKPEPDQSDPNAWPLGEVVAGRAFKTDAKGNAVLSVPLGAGAYRAVLETRDRFGAKVTALLPLRVLDPAAKKLAIKVPHLLAAPKWTVEPGEEFTALWASGYDTAQAFIEVEHRGKVLQQFWTDPGQTQVLVRQKVTEAMRGGFVLRVTLVRENRAYLESQRVEVPWSNKELKVRWERFTSKLEPGQKVTWTAVVTGPGAKKAVAEMVATLYDESLDAYYPHTWESRFQVFREDWSRVSSRFANHREYLGAVHGEWEPDYKLTDWAFRSFPQDVVQNFWGYRFIPGWGGIGPGGIAGGAGGPPIPIAEGGPWPSASFGPRGLGGLGGGLGGLGGGLGGLGGLGLGGLGGGTRDIQEQIQGLPPPIKLKDVAARKNLSETAFFFPHLLSDKDGEVRLQFTMPEALTRWKFLGFAHDKELRAGLLEGSAVTSRDLMVQPHPPRFLREGDEVEFTVKVTNRADAAQKGVVRLSLADAQTGKSADAALGNTANEKPFDIPAKESRTFAWRLRVPDGMGFLTYKAVAATAKLSDGEEGHLPVLSRRVLVTESLPLPLRGPQTKRFDFARLRQSGASDTLQHKQLTVQAVSNPSWYAILALPYLMEFPYECNEQTFNRLYANALARHIVESDPKIRKVFERWKGTPALDSPLEKNSDLRAVLLEETPWVLEARRESQARRNVGVLFDANRLAPETTHALKQLTDRQLPDGSWSWFPGGPTNDYITLYIVTGFGRLRHLGVPMEPSMAVKAIERLDGWIDGIHQYLSSGGRLKRNNLSPRIALYLYGRSFFLKERAIDKGHKPAVDYFLGQAKEHWLQLAHRQSQAHLALALHRFGDKDAAKGIMRSIKERSVTHEELGMFWRELELSWWWYRAPIETQAMMIEAFDEVMNDQKAVEDCKVWLLKQKQTQDWKTTKATADACYALLLRGEKRPLVSEALVEISLGGQTLQPEKVEAGTGFYEKRYLGSEVKPSLGAIVAKKTDEGVSWASVHWQYLEDAGKVTAYEGTPLKLKKELFTRVFTKKGPVLRAVRGPLKVGDELVVRLELRVDRDMEYVHLKDARGSGTEPVNVLSQYRYQDGLAYYESTRDTASHFFIDYLPKGTYVFEYATRVVHRGAYHTGTAQIQCMYAPEFNSHSASFLLRVE